LEELNNTISFQPFMFLGGRKDLHSVYAVVAEPRIVAKSFIDL